MSLGELAPVCVAIVGSGPAGLYAAAELLKREARVHVEMYDRLPTPGGLVRSGVSPDHADRRKMTAVYERLILGSGRFRFHGNVEVGTHVSQEELRRHHSAVIYACGASADRRLGIPGEDLPGSHAATEFVGWYNAHPDFADRHFDLSCERAVIIGNGNVALDVARMLLLGHEYLRSTDVADHALSALAESAVRELVVLGRRGPTQASFTVPELLELKQLGDVQVVIDSGDDLHQEDVDPQAGGGMRALRQRILAELGQAHDGDGRPKRLTLKFLTSPVAILGQERVEGIRVVRNRLSVDVAGAVRAEATSNCEDIACGLVVRSVGYFGRPIPGMPFDAASGVMPNRAGRVVADGHCLNGSYVVGWLKRGPSGVIGTNKVCAQETVTALLEDLVFGRLAPPASDLNAFDALLSKRSPQRMDYRAWNVVDRHERAAGLRQGRPRVRLSRVTEMFHITR